LKDRWKAKENWQKFFEATADWLSVSPDLDFKNLEPLNW